MVIAEFELRTDTGSLPYIQVFRVRDGHIVSLRDYFGPATTARAFT